MKTYFKQMTMIGLTRHSLTMNGHNVVMFCIGVRVLGGGRLPIYQWYAMF